MIGHERIVGQSVVKIKHRITFRIGSNANALLAYLKAVHPAAVVEDVIFNDDGTVTIQFMEEKADG